MQCALKLCICLHPVDVGADNIRPRAIYNRPYRSYRRFYAFCNTPSILWMLACHVSHCLMGSFLKSGDLLFAEFIAGGAEGVAYTALTGDYLKPDTGVQVLTAANVAIVVVVGVFLVAKGIADDGICPGDLPGIAAGDAADAVLLADSQGSGANVFITGSLTGLI